MKREEKSALTRDKILTAARTEFSRSGWRNASLNNLCAENGISKGIIYHHFRDKEELYLLCVEECFRELTRYLSEQEQAITGTVEQRLTQYFDIRFHFFTDNPVYLNIFIDAMLNPPFHLMNAIYKIRRDFDALNITFLRKLLENAGLRPDLELSRVIEDLEMYINYFNLRFQQALKEGESGEDLLRRHEAQCHRQLNILLYGILEVHHEDK